MAAPEKPIVNVADVPLQDFGKGEKFAVDYPDSGKMAVAAGIKNADFTTATYRGLGRITPADYWDGESS
jgi:hypothetical protein